MKCPEYGLRKPQLAQRSERMDCSICGREDHDQAIFCIYCHSPLCEVRPRQPGPAISPTQLNRHFPPAP